MGQKFNFYVLLSLKEVNLPGYWASGSAKATERQPKMSANFILNSKVATLSKELCEVTSSNPMLLFILSKCHQAFLKAPLL